MLREVKVKSRKFVPLEVLWRSIASSASSAAARLRLQATVRAACTM